LIVDKLLIVVAVVVMRSSCDRWGCCIGS